MPKTVIIPKGSVPPIAPYSPGIKTSNTVYISGTLAMDQENRTIGIGDVKAQTRAVLESIKGVLESAGGSMDDVVFNQIFLKDLGDYKSMNDVYAEYFPKDPPARYCIRADLVREEFLVEIASTAHIGQ